MKAIIVGAGIAGLTTGIALQKNGIDVEIYERTSELKAAGAGLTLWANAIHALDYIGLGDAIRDFSTDTQISGGIYTMAGKVLVSMDSAILEKEVGVSSLVIHRAELLDLLQDNFTGTIHNAKQFTHYQQNNQGVCAYFEDGSTAEGDILIACDGIHSPVRQQMFPNSQPSYSGYTAYRGIVDFDHSHVNNMWGEFWGYGNRFGITPLNQNRVYWFATANMSEEKILANESYKAKLLTLFKGWQNPIEALIKATPEDAILNNGIYEIDLLDSWQDGRVILLGDSAHAMTPNMGQGACQAIEDAITLGTIFEETSNVDMVLKRYQQARIMRANGVLNQSRQIGQLGQLSNPFLCKVRNFAVRLIPHNYRMKTLLSLIKYRV